jgi:hypothetical protein
MTVRQLLPFLSSTILPMSMRWQVVRGVILSRLLYGAEVYGMNRQLTNSMQTLLNRAMRAVLRTSVASSAIPSAPLWQEFNIAPICALAAARRARAYRKCFDLKTTIGTTIRLHMRSRKWTWSTGTVRWIRRYCAQYFPTVAPSTLDSCDQDKDWEDLSCHPLRDLVQASIWHRESDIRKSLLRQTGRATYAYFEGSYANRPLTVGRVFCHPRDHFGIAQVVQCRIGCYPTAPLLVETLRLPAAYNRTCPFCRGATQETLHHLLFVCRAWRRHRRLSGLSDTLRAVGQLHLRWTRAKHADPEAMELTGTTSLTSEALTLSWLLGGSYGKSWGLRTYMPKAPTPDDADEDNQSSSSSSDGGDPTAHGEPNHRQAEDRAHLLRVGTFLGMIVPPRRRILSSLLLPSPATRGRRQDPGAPASSTGQSPNG